MGGQACVFYGAAQVSKDVDLVVFAEPDNFARLQEALNELMAERIAVPRFDPVLLERGHAVHFRCQQSGVENLRIDIMTKLRGLANFETLWERRTIFQDNQNTEYQLLSIPDLVLAKKTQRSKDWPIIELLVAIHYLENRRTPTPNRIDFWLLESRTPEILVELVEAFPYESMAAIGKRDLLRLAVVKDMTGLRTSLDIERQEEQTRDRLYWEPLKKEMERFRFEELEQQDSNNGL